MNLTITRKITLGFAFAVVAIVGLSLAAYLGASRIDESAVETAHTLEVRHALEQAKIEHLLWETQVQHALGDERIWKIDVQTNHHKCDLGVWYYAEGRESAESYAPYLKTELDALEKPHAELHATAVETNNILETRERTAARRYFNEHGDPLVSEILMRLDTMIDEVNAQNTGEGHLRQMIEQNRSMTAGIGLTGVAFSAFIILLGLYLRNNISTILSNAINALSASSSQIGATSEEHEKVLGQQSAAVNETTATMEELGASSRLSTEHATSAAELVEEAAVSAQNGTRKVTQMTASMADLRQKVSAISQQILHLSDKTSQIDNIISAVTDLAGQTNMLALNAAVEAAHAGEQGKGFAVVAKEIRKLADQSKESAAHIGALVKEVQEVTNTTVMVAEDGTTTLDSATDVVKQTGDSFTSLANSVDTISQNVQQISLSAKQQATAIEQVVVAMNNISEGAKQSSIGLSQTREGVDQLVTLAGDIRSQI